MIPVTIFAGRDVAVLGLGVSGLSVACALKAGGARPIVWDDKQEARDEAAAQGFTVQDLAADDWSGFAALVLLASALVSLTTVARRVARFDLVAVLKARE